MTYTLKSLALLTLVACAPEGEVYDANANVDTLMGSVRNGDIAGVKVEVSGGTTAGTDKNCDPKKDPGCIDAGKVVKSGGGSDIHPGWDSDYDPEPWPFGFRGPTKYMDADVNEIGVFLVIDGDAGVLEDAARFDAKDAELYATSAPPSATLKYVHTVDEGLRSGAYSLLFEFDDESTFLANGDALARGGNIVMEY